MSNPPNIAGRVPPHDLDSEAAAVSAALLDPSAAAVVCALLQPAQLYSDSNGRILAVVGEMREAGVAVDVVTVASRLRERGQLMSVGGPSYIGQLAEATPSVSHVHLREHCRVVAQKHRLRRLIAECQRIAAESYFDVGDVDEWIDACEASIHELAVSRHAEEEASTATAVVAEVMAEILSDDPPTGLATGIRCLDRLMGPMRPGQMITIGAHSGVGKTSLALGFVLDVALRVNRGPRTGVAMFSLEMSKKELVERAIFTTAQVDSWKLQAKRYITDNEWDAITEAAKLVAVDNVWFDDRGGASALQVRAKARRIQAEAKRKGTPLGLIVVDYAQLLRGSGGRKNESREQEVAEISRAMKAMAKECDVPVIVLAQLNEDAIKEKRKPRPSDLRESKALFHDSDKVILIHNENASARASADRTNDAQPGALASEIVELIVGKNRKGRSGSVRVNFWPSITKFGEKYAADEAREDWTERAYG